MQICYLVPQNPSRYFKLQSIFSQAVMKQTLLELREWKDNKGFINQKVILTLEQEMLTVKTNYLLICKLLETISFFLINEMLYFHRILIAKAPTEFCQKVTLYVLASFHLVTSYYFIKWVKY